MASLDSARILSRPDGQSGRFCYETASHSPFRPNTERITVRHRRYSSPCDADRDASLTRIGMIAHASSSQGAPSEPQSSPEKMKMRLLWAWNNVKYRAWTVHPNTSFNKDMAIWLLGVLYHRKVEPQVRPRVAMQCVSSEVLGDENSSFQSFIQDFTSRLWFTYRREFPAIPGTNITTDCGWGCMLRSSQMILAQAFVMHFLGRQWRWCTEHTEGTVYMHRVIAGWFGDKPGDQSPFSLHNLVRRGRVGGKRAGDWYGPSSVAYILKDAMEEAGQSGKHRHLAELCIYVAQDCTIYLDDVEALCRAGSTSWRGVILFVPVRLGGERINPAYVPCIKAMLACNYCIGIIGGRPRHSLYFLGWQDDKVIYLDPHFCQNAVDVDPPDFPLHSFHCNQPRKMSFFKIDPSCTIGFYCKTKQDFEEFVRNIKEVSCLLRYSDFHWCSHLYFATGKRTRG